MADKGFAGEPTGWKSTTGLIRTTGTHGIYRKLGISAGSGMQLLRKHPL